MAAQEQATIEERTGRSLASVRVVTGAALVCVVTVIFASTRADPDLWGHLRFGLDVLTTRTLPAVDPYSWTQDKPQLYHEWLGAVLMAAAYAGAGSFGLVVLKLAICFAALLVLKPRLLELSLTDASLVAILIVWNMVPLTLFTRPQLWTMLAILSLLRLLQDGRYVWVPPLFALWANLHGGWVMGIGLLGVWCAATVCETWWKTRQVAWTIVALPPVAFAATALNPYGWHLWSFLADTVGLSRSDITDWQPLFSTWEIAHVPILITFGLLLAVVVNRKTRPSWAWLLVSTVLLYSSVRVSRVAFLSMPAILLIILPSLAVWLPRPKRRAAVPPRGAVAIALIPLTIGVIVTAVTIAPAFTCLPINGRWIPDPAAIPVLRQGVDGGRIVTFFDWGEYAIWHLGPRLQVSMDGRRETIYSDRMLAIHRAVYDNTEEGSAWLTRVRPEYVWLKTKHRDRRDWLAGHGYRIDWQSDKSWVAVRADLPRVSGPPTIASTGCFPGP